MADALVLAGVPSTPDDERAVPSGTLRVRLRRAVAGWVDLSVEAVFDNGRRQRLAMWASHVFCPFGSLLEWLECIAMGARSVSFDWDAENPTGRLSFDDDVVTIHWPSRRRGGGRIEMRVSPAQLVGAFYQALRHFAHSDDYDPSEYEVTTLGEALACRDGRGLTPDELLGHALALDRVGLEALLWRADEPREPLVVRASKTRQAPWQHWSTDPQRWLAAGRTVPCWNHAPAWWDRAPTLRRRVWLQARFASPHGGFDGASLRTLRSRRIETRLRWRAPQDPPLTWP